MAIKKFRDGRVWLSGKDLAAHRLQMWEDQGRVCDRCGLYLPLKGAHLDHFGASRGMNGSKRNDLDPRNRLVHGWCHAVRHFKERDAAGWMKKVNLIVTWA